jgi:hypothetical protein
MTRMGIEGLKGTPGNGEKDAPKAVPEGGGCILGPQLTNPLITRIQGTERPGTAEYRIQHGESGKRVEFTTRGIRPDGLIGKILGLTPIGVKSNEEAIAKLEQKYGAKPQPQGQVRH